MTSARYYYLLFVLEQARILARKAQRSGLYERARHYRLQEDWADEQLQEAIDLFGAYLSGV